MRNLKLAGQGGKGLDVAAQEALQRLIEREARVHRARPRQHEDEALQRSAGTADLNRTEMGPIGLRLLAA